jgi:6-pyruvoyl-tetrahydropterin synthase
LGTENERRSHHYVLELQLDGLELNKHGYLVDIVQVEAELRDVRTYHADRVLYELPEFEGLNLSIEHFARIVCQRFGKPLAAPNLSGIGVRLWENNVASASYRYAETTSTEYSVSGRDVPARARGFGMPSVAVDGQDVFAIYEAVAEAVARARRGDGPSFIEAQTYRYFGHFEGDTVKYHTKEEEAFYRGRDCIDRFRETVLQQGLLTEADLAEIDARTANIIEDAEPGSIGLSSIDAHLGLGSSVRGGVYLRMGNGGQRVLAPIAPGLVTSVNVTEYRALHAGDEVRLWQPQACTLALDGEREVTLRGTTEVCVRLKADGPRVVDVRRAVAIAAQAGIFVA